MSNNPYLRDARLADVIAAITALGTYKFYKLDFGGWSERISGPIKQADHWEIVFREHPEFFRINTDEKKASLVWRRQFRRNYDVDSQAEVPDHELSRVSASRVSRKPLAPSEITTLIGVAINLHDRGLEQEKARKWWVPFVTGLLAFVGGLLGALLTAWSQWTAGGSP